MNLSSFRTYYRLTKPGIIYGNCLVALGAFLYASKGSPDLGLLAAMLGGTSLIIASACVVNNYLDRGIDQKMARTRGRALVQGTISAQRALLFAAVMGVLGCLLLAVFTNTVTLLAGVFGYLVYVVWYGLAKRRSVHGTLVGSLSGAIPPLAGYTAVTGQIDTAALLLFLILTAWQMPHFYAIATYRAHDYQAAGIPVLPVVKGESATQYEMLLYIALFCVACGLMTAFGLTGYTFLLVMLGLGLGWLRLAYTPLSNTVSPDRWARQVFFYSLILLPVLSVLLALEHILP